MKDVPAKSIELILFRRVPSTGRSVVDVVLVVANLILRRNEIQIKLDKTPRKEVRHAFTSPSTSPSTVVNHFPRWILFLFSTQCQCTNPQPALLPPPTAINNSGTQLAPISATVRHNWLQYYQPTANSSTAAQPSKITQLSQSQQWWQHQHRPPTTAGPSSTPAQSPMDTSPSTVLLMFNSSSAFFSIKIQDF